MPLLLGLLLVTLFIWFAENIGTFARVWAYPHQGPVWTPVSPAKIGAWYLLMLISYTLVVLVRGAPNYATSPRTRTRAPPAPPVLPSASPL